MVGVTGPLRESLILGMIARKSQGVGVAGVPNGFWTGAPGVAPW